MKTNKIDKNIKGKFANRTFTPSASAWERLSVQLDEQPKQKKIGWFFYIGAAASILLLVTVGIQLFSDDSVENSPKEEVVIMPIPKEQIDAKIDNLINEIKTPEAFVIKEEVEVKQEIIHLPVIANKKGIAKDYKLNKKPSIEKIKKEQLMVAKVEDDKIEIQSNSIKQTKEILKQDPNSTIKINAADLLYAVTHSSKEVKAYYAKYNVNREDVLKTIKSELKKSNLKVNPNTILAEVERSIDDDFFENNFMKGLKRRVSDIAVAIASRND